MSLVGHPDHHEGDRAKHIPLDPVLAHGLENSVGVSLREQQGEATIHVEVCARPPAGDMVPRALRTVARQVESRHGVTVDMPASMALCCGVSWMVLRRRHRTQRRKNEHEQQGCADSYHQPSWTAHARDEYGREHQTPRWGGRGRAARVL